MTQDTSTYYVWIGGSCDYGHKERAGGAAVVIENNGSIISRDAISDLHTTEFRHDADTYDQGDAGNPGRFRHRFPDQRRLYSEL